MSFYSRAQMPMFGGGCPLAVLPAPIAYVTQWARISAPLKLRDLGSGSRYRYINTIPATIVYTFVSAYFASCTKDFLHP